MTIASDEVELTIHYADYYALHHRVRSLIEMYSSHLARRTKYGLVFVVERSRIAEIQAMMTKCATGTAAEPDDKTLS